MGDFFFIGGGVGLYCYSDLLQFSKQNKNTNLKYYNVWLEFEFGINFVSFFLLGIAGITSLFLDPGK